MVPPIVALLIAFFSSSIRMKSFLYVLILFCRGNGMYIDERTLRGSEADDSTGKGDEESGGHGMTDESRIVGGIPVTDPDKYPFFANPNRLGCGSTLIHPDILLTAAHCDGTDDEFNDWFKGVRIGGIEEGSGEEIGVSGVLKHRGFIRETSPRNANDIMLVKLSNPSSQPLVAFNNDPNYPPDNALVTAIGHGRTSYDGEGSIQLREVDLYVDFACTGWSQYPDDLILCVDSGDGGDESTCNGDSGGPILDQNNLQVGLMSFGAANECNTFPTPRAATKVSTYANWILDGICLLSSNPPSSCNDPLRPRDDLLNSCCRKVYRPDPQTSQDACKIEYNNRIVTDCVPLNSFADEPSCSDRGHLWIDEDSEYCVTDNGRGGRQRICQTPTAVFCGNEEYCQAEECKECRAIQNCRVGYVSCTNFYDEVCLRCDENYYLSENKKTCDSTPPSPTPPRKEFCFSGNMEVVVKDKGAITMNTLQVGDFVKTGNGEAYEKVYAFGHRVPERHTVFVQIHSHGGTPLEMTGEHLVFVYGKENPVRADSIKIGDVLQAQDKSAAVVQDIKLVQRIGIYNPLTASGTIQVNGISASTYISFQKENNEYIEFPGGIKTTMSHHDFAHRAMAPLRFYCTSLATCNINDANHGMSVYVSKGIELVQWSKQQHILLQLLAWGLFHIVILVSILMTCAVIIIPTYLISKKSIRKLQYLVSLTQ